MLFGMQVNCDRSYVVKEGMEKSKKRYWFNVIYVFVFILHEASSVFAFVHVYSCRRESLCSTLIESNHVSR